MIKTSAIKDITISITKALAYLHSKNICHRDIKLENILVNELGIVKMIDFGFAVVQSTNQPVTNFCGTPSYMSPEIIKREPYDGYKADMWALGIVLYRLLCGRFPFTGNTDQELYLCIVYNEAKFPGSVSKKARGLVGRLLDKSPGNRPSAQEVLGDDWFSEN